MTSTRAVRTARSTHPTTTLLASVPRRFNDCYSRGPLVAVCEYRNLRKSRGHLRRPEFHRHQLPRDSAFRRLLYVEIQKPVTTLCPAARIPIVPRLRLTC
jgi:hypothetical protein